MDINILPEVITVLSFLAFASIVVYAYTPKNRERFEEAARLPLDDETLAKPSPQPSPKGEGANVGQGFANWERP